MNLPIFLKGRKYPNGEEIEVAYNSGETKIQQCNGSPVEVADGSFDDLTWDFTSGPDTLLDITSPALPVVLVEGLYTVSITVGCEPLTADGNFQVSLHLDVENTDVEYLQASAAAKYGGSANAAPPVSISGSAIIPAGGAIRIEIFNSDGAASRIFTLSQAVIMKIG